MGFIGKTLVIPGADFSDIRVASIKVGAVYRTIPLIAIPYAYGYAMSVLSYNVNRATTYGDVKAGDVLEVDNPDSTFDNQLLVYKVDPSGTPEFADGVIPSEYSETFVDFLRPDYSAEAYTFTEDCRFLAVMKDNLNSTTRDFTSYAPFGLYNLRREFKKGEATPVHAYYGTYDMNTSTFVFDSANSLRALVMLDLRAGDVVESADVDNLKFDVFKIQSGTVNTYESKLTTGYVTTTWTSNVRQRVLLVAKNLSNPDGLVTNDLNAVFKVTFNS